MLKDLAACFEEATSARECCSMEAVCTFPISLCLLQVGAAEDERSILHLLFYFIYREYKRSIIIL
jgi:hypothetical protein